MTKSIYAALLATACAATLGACSGGEPAVQADTSVSELEASNARLALPAVAGNPAALYFDLKNNGTKAYAIRKAEVKGAKKTEIHAMMEWSGKMTMGETGPQTVEPGGTVKFESGGLHVMVFDLDPALKAGGTTDVTLTVAGGKTYTFPVTLNAAGDNR